VCAAGGGRGGGVASCTGGARSAASSYSERWSYSATTAMFGEVGLAGEVRGISQASLRIREAAQMGFRRCVMPEANVEPKVRSDGDCELIGVRNVGEALDVLLT